jgi:tRNA-splicing ligase RtcB
MNKKESVSEKGKCFLKEIELILKEFGVKSNLIEEDVNYVNPKGEISIRYRLQISSVPKNLIRLWSTIGYEYNRKKTIFGKCCRCLFAE